MQGVSSVSWACCAAILLALSACDARARTPNFADPRIDVRIVTDEADAVLAVLTKRERGEEIAEADWQRIFASEGYVRLKKRELSMSRPFTETDFKAFVLDPTQLAQRPTLAETLARWKALDVRRPARAALAYLPANARIRAKIYPVIKPRTNSFVFDLPDDPAIFLYLDPTMTREKFENTLAHELHHIGFGRGARRRRLRPRSNGCHPTGRRF